MSTEAYIGQKKRNADMWVGFYDRNKDRSGAINAAMAVGRLVGALEMLRQQQREALAPEYQQMMHHYEQVWQRITLGE